MLGTAATKSQDSGFGDREVVTHMVSWRTAAGGAWLPTSARLTLPSFTRDALSEVNRMFPV